MVLAFVSSQHGLTFRQQQMLPDILRRFRPSAIHHADVIGGDEQMDLVAQDLRIATVEHVPLEEDGRAFLFASTYRPARAYAERYRALIEETDALLLAPLERVEQPNSFVWAARRYAVRIGKPVHLIKPE